MTNRIVFFLRKQRTVTCILKIKTAIVITALMIFGVVIGTVQAGTVMGTISIEGAKKLRNIIIYMEPSDGQIIQDGESIRVIQKNSTFQPAFNVIVKGSKVDFVNNETKNIDHNVFSLSQKGKFDIGLMSKDSSEAVLFHEVGLIKFYCSVHKSMQGVLSVVPTPYYAKLSSSNDFKIDNVPPGKWTIKAMIGHRRYTASAGIEQTVTDGEATNIEMVISKKSRKKKIASLGNPLELAMIPVDIVIPADGIGDIVVMLSLDGTDSQVIKQ
jgi:plastocyanin